MTEDLYCRNVLPYIITLWAQLRLTMYESRAKFDNRAEPEYVSVLFLQIFSFPFIHIFSILPPTFIFFSFFLLFPLPFCLHLHISSYHVHWSIGEEDQSNYPIHFTSNQAYSSSISSLSVSLSFWLSPHISRIHFSLVDWKLISQSVQYIPFPSNLTISHLILSFFLVLSMCDFACVSVWLLVWLSLFLWSNRWGSVKSSGGANSMLLEPKASGGIVVGGVRPVEAKWVHYCQLDGGKSCPAEVTILEGIQASQAKVKREEKWHLMKVWRLSFL